VTVEYLDLADYIAISAEVTGSVAGRQQTGCWVALRLFVELNGWRWNPMPSIDEAEAAVLAIAGGEWREEATAAWLRDHLVPPER